tara:strand:- start:123 stop:1487 length:1365 start_codon:yes stop_codon:yes gene_type:complete
MARDAVKIACNLDTYSGKKLKEYLQFAKSALIVDLQKLSIDLSSDIKQEIDRQIQLVSRNNVHIRVGALEMACSLLRGETVKHLLENPFAPVVFTGFSMGGFCATGYAFIFAVLVKPILMPYSLRIGLEWLEIERSTHTKTDDRLVQKQIIRGVKDIGFVFTLREIHKIQDLKLTDVVKSGTRYFKPVETYRTFNYYLAGSVRVGNLEFSQYLQQAYPNSCHLTAMVGVTTKISGKDIATFEPDPVSLIPREEKSVENTTLVSTYPNYIVVENLSHSKIKLGESPFRNRLLVQPELINSTDKKPYSILSFCISSAKCIGIQVSYKKIVALLAAQASLTLLIASIISFVFRVPVGIIAPGLQIGSGTASGFSFKEVVLQIIAFLKGDSLDNTDKAQARSGQMWWVHNEVTYLNLLSNKKATFELDIKELDVNDTVWADTEHYAVLRNVAYQQNEV